MISLATVLIFVVFSSFFLFSIWPLLLDKVNNDQNDYDMIHSLERRKSILYREIQYLDNEYFIESINIDDYNSSREELVSEVSEIIDKIKSVSSNQII
tara:strand:- start:534 stop:827 length:294 start_codon:yes stop_codon:yes gene_type:complete